MKIGIDIMGGDFAPEKTVIGAVKAANELSKDTSLVLFGHKSEIFSKISESISFRFFDWKLVLVSDQISKSEIY